MTSDDDDEESIDGYMITVECQESMERQFCSVVALRHRFTCASFLDVYDRSSRLLFRICVGWLVLSFVP
jgi:hypothetical protein